MTLHRKDPRAKPRWVGLAITVLAATLVTGGTVLATLSPSTFNAADGNLVVNGSEKDWANVAGVQVGVDKATGQQDDSFGNGTKEDSPVPSVIDGSIPNNKSDLTRFLVASEKVAGKDFLYLAWERVQEPSGTTNMDFEFNKSEQLSTNGVTPVRTAGDLLIKYDLAQGGTTPVLGYHRWITTGAGSQCEANNAVPCWDKVHPLSGNFEGSINTVQVVDPVPPNAPRNLSPRTFGEASINLTDSGIFPAGSCSGFGSGYLKSRSSDAFTAAVKDFIAPIDVNIRNCGGITIKKVTQNAPAGDTTSFSYTTTGGLTPSTFGLLGGGERAYTDVVAGSYSVTEGAQSSPWNFVSVNCTSSGTGTSTSTSGQTASITLAPDGAVTCTFTNHYTNTSGISTAQDILPNDSATITGVTASAGGTVSFKLFSPADVTCSSTAAYSQSVTVSGPGTYSTTNSTFHAIAEGTWRWLVVYSGDANNTGSTSACGVERFTIANT